MQGPKDGRSLKPPRRAVPVESWRPVALLVATGVVAAFQIGKIPLSLNYLQSDFGFDLVMAGWVASLFAVMGAVCAVLLLDFVCFSYPLPKHCTEALGGSAREHRCPFSVPHEEATAAVAGG